MERRNMNKNYKVVFSKARGALMVVNELTSSVQAKGTKTVIAGAVASLVAGGAMAAEPSLNGGVFNWDGAESRTSTSIYASDKQVSSVPTYANVTEVNITDGSFKPVYGSALAFAGTQKITIKNSTISGAQNSALFLNGHKGNSNVTADGFSNSIVVLDNVTIKDNQSSAGGGLYMYGKAEMTVNSGSFEGNKALSNKKNDQAYGGAAVVKSGKVVFKDVLFKDNVAEASNGYATGGAVLVDITTSIKENGKDSVGDVTFKITKDMTYTGNNVVGSNDAGNTYGWYAYTSGGFLFLDRASFGTFDIDAGATLTLGTADAQGDMDSIASALPNSDKQNPKYATLTKKGEGTLVLNTALDKYFGIFNVESGSVVLNKAWNSRAHTTVSGGLLRAVSGISLDTLKSEKGDFWQAGELTVTGTGSVETASLSMKNTGASNGDKTVLNVAGGTLTIAGDLDVASGAARLSSGTVKVGGAVKVGESSDASFIVSGGILDAKSSAIFDGFQTEGMALNSAIGSGASFTGGTINLSDYTGTYTLADLNAMQKLLNQSNSVKVTMTNGKLDAAEATLDQVTTAGANVAGETVSTEVSTGSAVVTVANGNDATVGSVMVEAAEGSTDAAATNLVLKEGTLTLAGGLNGETKAVVEGALADDFKITVGDAQNEATLVLGFDDTSSGTLDKTVSVTDNSTLAVAAGTFELAKVETSANSVVEVANESTLKLGELAGTGTVLVGDKDSAGNVEVDKLTMTEGLIFLDPAWHEGSTIADASSFAVKDLGSSVGTQFAVGQNSLLSLGADRAAAAAAFESVASVNGLTWSEKGVTAAAYADAPVKFDATGGLLIDGSMTSETTPQPTVTAGKVDVAANGMLIVNQKNAAAGSWFTVGEDNTAKVTFADGSYLGIVNATEGTVQLAGTVTNNGAKVVTDNPFIAGAFGTGDKANTVITTFDSESGLGAIASTGVQAMARRADFVMTETVANRTSLDQPMHAGVNLWADVSGERYEADKLDNNGSFRADAAYATFGGDVEVLEGLTAGLALQYGDASLRSDVSGIKNDITSYGLTAYAGKSFGAAKVVGELAWLKSENDITAHQTALNQKLDANIYSAGVRAQYELAAGSFKFVPSIGLRVSRLETDDMTVGSIKVDEGDLTYVQMPISLRISGFEADAAGWTLAPSFKVAYVPTFGDKEVKVLGYSQDVLDMSPVQADFGLRAVNGNLMFNVDMMLGGGEAGTSSIGGKVGVKYAF